MAAHSIRRQRATEAIQQQGLEVLLVSHEPNVRYLTGFTGEATTLLLGPRHSLMASDSRFETQLADQCPELPTAIRTAKSTPTEFLASVIQEQRLSRIGVEAGSMTVQTFARLKEHLPGVELVPTEGIVERLRQVKDAEEIAAIRRAVSIAERGFAAMRALLTGDMTELETAHELEHFMRRLGALKAAFEPIVGVGRQSALPHYRGGRIRIDESAFVLVDWGAVEPGGYHSDLTRVLSTSNIPPKLEELHRVVLSARNAALDQMRPGVECKAVDEAARTVIANAGYERFFGHGLGHGIGLEIHEGPRFSPVSSDILQPGMVVTVEPGIYLPEFGGVRLEDDVLITDTGYEILSSVPLEMS